MFYLIKKFKIKIFKFIHQNYKIFLLLFTTLGLLGFYCYFQDNKKLKIASTQPTIVTEIPIEKDITISGVVSSKQTCSKILSEFFSGKVVQDILKASEKVYPLKRIKKGQGYTIIYTQCENEEKQLKYFEYEIDQYKKVILEQKDTAIVAQISPIEYDYELLYINNVINTNLFEAVITTGEQASLVSSLVNIFGAEIDFIKDLRVGDTFGILVEKRFKKGTFKGYGRILAAKIINKGCTYEGYRFPCDKGYNHYYTSKGESLKRMFLKAPLEFTRISSGFSFNRKHPIHSERRPHLGVDYAAPTGTPVKAVGDGTVKKVGWLGGFGNVVVVKHKNGFETMYGHLSRFSCNAKVGRGVKQGQVIGFVGATGVATGPHLDFRVKFQGHYVNPVKMLNPRVASISENKIEEYKRLVLELKSYMNGTQSCRDYKPEKIL